MIFKVSEYGRLQNASSAKSVDVTIKGHKLYQLFFMPPTLKMVRGYIAFSLSVYPPPVTHTVFAVYPINFKDLESGLFN